MESKSPIAASESPGECPPMDLFKNTFVMFPIRSNHEYDALWRDFTKRKFSKDDIPLLLHVRYDQYDVFVRQSKKDEFHEKYGHLRRELFDREDSLVRIHGRRKAVEMVISVYSKELDRDPCQTVKCLLEYQRSKYEELQAELIRGAYQHADFKGVLYFHLSKQINCALLFWPPSHKRVIDLAPGSECDALEDYIADTGFGYLRAPVFWPLASRQYDIFVSKPASARFEVVNRHLDTIPFEEHDELAHSLGKLRAAKHAIKELESLLEMRLLPGTEQLIRDRISYYAEIEASLVGAMQH
ncbi:hypothetical protein CIHG_09959 [Coccidioides immitis H538.4]|uniref:Uncharacterized protein n=1 Tax=Coccidioides immitis H538.4 TaxID=396776 RepID=A0A0J8S729_COCIT|nr:hypothetical protein CIHG_09959 [Coccidioides immitis H538.4]